MGEREREIEKERERERKRDREREILNTDGNLFVHLITAHLTIGRERFGGNIARLGFPLPHVRVAR